jgi:hypothetical protein
MPSCGDCKYFGFRGLEKWCRHPDHLRAIRKWGKQCPDWVEWDAKHMPGHPAPWPYPVSLAKTEDG